MKKGIAIVLGLLIVGGGVYYMTQNRNKGKGKGRERNAQVVQVQRGSIEDYVESTGVVQPLNRVEIKPPISGRIEKLLVDEGAVVHSGQILGWMSSTDRAAVLDAARAKGPEELKRWQDAYKPTPIIAPLSGTIILRNVVVGQTVDGGTIIAAMSDHLIVKANVDETDIGRVRMEMPALITLDSYPNEPIEGIVTQILHEGVNVSNVITYPVKIAPKTVPPFFRSQMTANVKLISQKKDDILLLPTAAVTQTTGGEKQVTLRGTDGKSVAVPVKTGLETSESVEIVEGLKEGDSVLVISRRYVPQQAAASSPLVMGGQQRQGQAQGQGQRQGGQGNRRQQQ